MQRLAVLFMLFGCSPAEAPPGPAEQPPTSPPAVRVKPTAPAVKPAPRAPVAPRQEVLDSLAAVHSEARELDAFFINGSIEGCEKARVKHAAKLDYLRQQVDYIDDNKDLNELASLAWKCASCAFYAWDACWDLRRRARELGATPAPREPWETKLPRKKSGAARTRERATLIAEMVRGARIVPTRCEDNPGVQARAAAESADALEARALALDPHDEDLLEAADMLHACADCSPHWRTYCGRAAAALERARGGG